MGNVNNKFKLNLGCGDDIRTEYVNLDIVSMPGVDVVHDLRVTPLPFQENEFEEIFTSHCLEHLPNFVDIMQELWRITKPNGIIDIYVPYFASELAFRDPTHVNFFTYKTFTNWIIRKEYTTHLGKTMRFKILKRKISFFGGNPKRWWNFLVKFINIPLSFPVNLFPVIFERFFCFVYPCTNIHYRLQVIK